MYLRNMTTDQAVSEVTAKLSKDISNLSARKNSALSAFRQTAQELGDINDGLRDRVAKCQELVRFINEQENSANLMISDNEKVRENILKLLGGEDNEY